MITTALLEKYRNGDFIQYMNNVLTVFTEEKASTLNLTAERTAFKTSIDALNAIWSPSRGSALTAQIAELDKQRDSLFIGFKITVDTWSKHHHDANKKNAALAISQNIANHGKEIIALRYQRETAVLTAIVKDLQNELSTQVNTLGLSEWITRISTVNTEFNALYLERSLEDSGNEKAVVETHRNDVTLHFKNLKRVFEARLTIAQIEESNTLTDYTALANDWSAVTNTYNEAVSRTTSNDSTTKDVPINDTETSSADTTTIE